MKWLCGVLVAMCGMSASLLAQTKVVLIGGTAYVDAVKSLGCTPGIGNGSGNAAKINAYLASRPKYPLFIPGGALEIDDTIVLPAQKGVSGIFGNSQGGDLNDNSYTGSTQGGQPTRLVWAGAENKAMIQVDSLFARIEGLSLQARRQPNAEPNNTGVKARIGIHVRTFNDTGTPTGKGKFRDLTFYGIPNGILFGRDLDTPDGTAGYYNADNSDETLWDGLHFFFPFNAGYGTGTLTTRTSDTAGVVTLGSSSHGISQGSPVDIAWSGGSRTGMYVTNVSGAAITVSGGAGANFPADLTPITDCQEERTAFRFRNNQAVGFEGGHVMIHGHPENVFWFERGSKLVQHLVSLSGWLSATRQMNVLKLGNVGAGNYYIGCNTDASAKAVKYLTMSNYTTPSFVHFRMLNSDPHDEVYADVPLFEVKGGCNLIVENMRRLPDSAILLAGNPGNTSNRQQVAACHLRTCGMYDAVWPTELVHGSSTGPGWLSWRQCFAAYNGPLNTSGFQVRPVQDDDKLYGDVTKLTNPSP